MEVRMNDHGPNSLSTKALFSDETGFAVASVIVMGQTDAALLDAQWSLSNGHRVAAEILETGKHFKNHLYYPRPSGPLFRVGTDRRGLSRSKGHCPARGGWHDKQADVRKNRSLARHHRADECTNPRQSHIEPLSTHYFELEGQRIEIIPKVMGDLKYNTVVWIPSIKTLYGSDVLFNQAHPFTCEITAEERKQWLTDIEQLEKLGAEVVIPGHQKPGMPFDLSSFKFMKDYLIATEEELERTADTSDFFYAMAMRFPDANLIFLSNEMNAAVFKGGRDWNWRDE